MPKFPHSTYSASAASGVLIRNQGGPAPIVEGDAPESSPDQFKVTLNKSEGQWWVGVAPGWAHYPNYTILLTSTGNRDVVVGDSSIDSEADFAYWRHSYIDAVHGYYSKRFSSVANQLSLGQQYSVPSGEISYVIMVCSVPGGDPPRLLVISAADYQDCYAFGAPDPSNDLGTSAVALTLSNSALNGTTVTINGNTVLTDATTVSAEVETYWKRLGLSAKLIAVLNLNEGQVLQVHSGPIHMDATSEHYSEQNDNVSTPPDVVDGGWSAAYYVTDAVNSPSGMTFDYSYPAP